MSAESFYDPIDDHDYEGAMASITIRNLDEALESRLRIQAAVHGRSMADEVRDILRASLFSEAQSQKKLGTAIHALFKPLGGFDMPPIRREPLREPPGFD